MGQLTQLVDGIVPLVDDDEVVCWSGGALERSVRLQVEVCVVQVSHDIVDVCSRVAVVVALIHVTLVISSRIEPSMVSFCAHDGCEFRLATFNVL